VVLVHLVTENHAMADEISCEPRLDYCRFLRVEDSRRDRLQAG
jgi:hypothetical protein